MSAKEQLESINPKTWDDVEEDDPTPDEIAAIEEYRAEKMRTQSTNP